eukprot:s4134_g7.t1
MARSSGEEINLVDSEEERGAKPEMHEPSASTPRAAAGVTPRKRKISLSAPAAVGGKSTCASILEIFGKAAGEIVTVEGVILQMSDVKVISGPRGKRRVLTLVVGDQQALMQLNVWNQCCDRHAQVLQQGFEGAKDFLKIRIMEFEVVEVGPGSPKRLVKLQSTKSSDFKVLGNSQMSIVPDDTFVLRDFSSLGVPHQCVAPRGQLSSLSELKSSKAGISMKSGLLVDEQGVAIRLMLHGGAAEDDNLVEGLEVIVFWACSLPPLDQSDEEISTGYYWCYGETYILEVARPEHRVQVAAVKEIPHPRFGTLEE